PQPFSAALPNDGVALYGSAAPDRLRVLPNGGLSPAGARSLYPTDFSHIFRVEKVDARGVVRWVTPTGIACLLAGETLAKHARWPLCPRSCKSPGDKLYRTMMTSMLRIATTRLASSSPWTKQRLTRSMRCRFRRLELIHRFTTPVGRETIRRRA